MSHYSEEPSEIEFSLPETNQTKVEQIRTTESVKT